jgi:hypothetical protein
MKHCPIAFQYSALLCLLLCATVAASSLESKNPFLPPGHNTPKVVAPPPVQTNGPIAREIEFRGVVEINGAYKLSLFNKSDQKSYWIKVGEKKEGIHVTAFDLDSMAVTLHQNGRSERLSLMEATDAPMPVVVSTQATPQTATPRINLPPGLQNATNSNTNQRRVIPRRRVILPKK